MSILDAKRLDPKVFCLDQRMRHGYYSDQYFLNLRQILTALADEGYRFRGRSPIAPELDLGAGGLDVGNIEVEMQVFAKREPFTVACGVDNAIAILKQCTGWLDESGAFRSTAPSLEVEAVLDGAKVAPWAPALKVRGRYRDFAILETTILGVLARQSRVATNTYRLLEAAGGKPVFFFPARYDLPATQSADGYAYKVGVDRYNLDTGRSLPAMITTQAQGEWWAGRGSGTMSHSYVLSFLGDCAQSMLQFARLLPPEVKRVALVDTDNDVVRDSLCTANAMWANYRTLLARGDRGEAEKYRLFGVRCDTAVEVRDVSVEPTGDPRLDNGVTPQLVNKLRRALDGLATGGDVAEAERDEARRYFQGIRIVVSGGFDCERIAWFESLGVPVDIYGVGSSFLTTGHNDFTADVVRVKVGGRWVHMAKVGRRAMPNPDLVPVPMG